MPNQSRQLKRSAYKAERAAVTAAATAAPDRPEEEMTIDLLEVWTLIKKHIWTLLLAAIVCGAGAGLYTAAFIPPTYASSGTVFLTPQGSNGGVDLTAINTNQKLITNVMNLLKQDVIMNKVAEQTGLGNADDVRKSLTITNIPDTEIIEVTSTTRDPELSKKIVADTLDTFISTMKDNLNVKNIQITNLPKLDYTPVGPNMKRNIVLGAAAGFAGGIGILFLMTLLDKRIKTREEAESFLGLPVYAELPDLEGKTAKR